MVDVATFCGNCGNASSADHRYCPKCGSALSSFATVSTSEAPAESNRPMADRPEPDTEPMGVVPDSADRGTGPILVPQSTNGLAVASLVCGILGITVIGPILALVFGYTARKQIDDSFDSAGNDEQKGRGVATAGIVLGWVWLAVAVAAIGIIGVVAAVGGQETTKFSADSRGNSVPVTYATVPSTSPPATVPWTPPAGFYTLPGHPAFAYKYVPNNEFKCDGLFPCWNVTVIAHHGCPLGISVTLTVAEPDGTPLDSATDQATGTIAPGQPTLLQPQNESGQSNVTGAVSNIACWP